jgi:hypothetical protein
MRSGLAALMTVYLGLLPALANADETSQGSNRNLKTYRGYFSEVSATGDGQDVSTITGKLHHQLDIVEGAGLSPRVLKFFRTVPILVDEAACLDAPPDPKALRAACYGPSGPLRYQHNRAATVFDNEKGEWINSDAVDLAEDTKLGLVMFRPITLTSRDGDRPILLHEFLHAYHAKMLPEGFKNPTVLLHYNAAKALYPSDAYLVTNEREFFAVTASVFLYGKEAIEPFTRSKIREKQPEYYNYLIWLFGFDPDKRSIAPLASAN